MSNSRKAKRFYAAIDRGLSRRRSLEVAGYRCKTPGSIASTAHALIRDRYGKKPRGWDKLRPCLQQVWINLTPEDRAALEDLNPKTDGTLADNLKTYLRAYAPSTAPPPPPPQPVPPPKPPDPEPYIDLSVPIATEELQAIWRAQNWDRYILYGGRNIDDPAPEPSAIDGEWSQARGFISADQLAQEAYEASQPKDVFIPSDIRGLLTGRKR